MLETSRLSHCIPVSTAGASNSLAVKCLFSLWNKLQLEEMPSSVAGLKVGSHACRTFPCILSIRFQYWSQLASKRFPSKKQCLCFHLQCALRSAFKHPNELNTCVYGCVMLLSLWCLFDLFSWILKKYILTLKKTTFRHQVDWRVDNNILEDLYFADDMALLSSHVKMHKRT